MRNPCYLFLSRHNVYYLRFPLSQITSSSVNNKHIKLSLRTREPKEALALSNMIKAKARDLASLGSFEMLTYKQCKDMFEGFYEESLQRIKQNLSDKTISVEQLDAHESMLKNYESDLESRKTDKDYHGHYQLAELDDTHFNEIKDKHSLSTDTDLKMLKKIIKDIGPETYVEYLKNLLAIKQGYDTESNQISVRASNANIISLDGAIEKYIEEKSQVEAWGMRAKEERIDCFKYLKEALPTVINVQDMDKAKARAVKEMLLATPKSRNKNQATRGKALSNQIVIKKQKNLEGLSTTTINKYLQTYSGLFKWVSDNGYTEINPFDSLNIRENAKKAKEPKRNPLTKSEIKLVLEEIGKKENGLFDTDTRYWGTLIAIYTGARLNEIASLTPSDFKLDEATGIYYFDINKQDSDSKSLKTMSSERVIPVHSKLIELGLIEYVAKAKRIVGKKSGTDNNSRLLYDLTYTEGEGWGRKLGRWFNDKLMVKLDIKTPKTSFHSLRHSFITNLGVSGVEHSTIQAIAGHEGDTITASVYTHYGVEHLTVFKDAVEKLGY